MVPVHAFGLALICASGVESDPTPRKPVELKPKWTVTIENGGEFSYLTEDDKHVYMGHLDEILKIHRATGKLVWRTASKGIGSATTDGPVVNGFLFLMQRRFHGYHQPAIYAMEAASGKVVEGLNRPEEHFQGAFAVGDQIVVCSRQRAGRMIPILYEFNTTTRKFGPLKLRRRAGLTRPAYFFAGGLVFRYIPGKSPSLKWISVDNRVDLQHNPKAVITNDRSGAPYYSRPFKRLSIFGTPGRIFKLPRNRILVVGNHGLSTSIDRDTGAFEIQTQNEIGFWGGTFTISRFTHVWALSDKPKRVQTFADKINEDGLDIESIATAKDVTWMNLQYGLPLPTRLADKAPVEHGETVFSHNNMLFACIARQNGALEVRRLYTERPTTTWLIRNLTAPAIIPLKDCFLVRTWKYRVATNLRMYKIN